MSSFRTLDEIPSEELVRELSKRHHLRMGALKCPYCARKLVIDDGQIMNCTCRFSEVDKYHSPYVLAPLQQE